MAIETLPNANEIPGEGLARTSPPQNTLATLASSLPSPTGTASLSRASRSATVASPPARGFFHCRLRKDSSAACRNPNTCVQKDSSAPLTAARPLHAIAAVAPTTASPPSAAVLRAAIAARPFVPPSVRPLTSSFCSTPASARVPTARSTRRQKLPSSVCVKLRVAPPSTLTLTTLCPRRRASCMTSPSAHRPSTWTMTVLPTAGATHLPLKLTPPPCPTNWSDPPPPSAAGLAELAVVTAADAPFCSPAPPTPFSAERPRPTPTAPPSLAFSPPPATTAPPPVFVVPVPAAVTSTPATVTPPTVAPLPVASSVPPAIPPPADAACAAASSSPAATRATSIAWRAPRPTATAVSHRRIRTRRRSRDPRRRPMLIGCGGIGALSSNSSSVRCSRSPSCNTEPRRLRTPVTAFLVSTGATVAAASAAVGSGRAAAATSAGTSFNLLVLEAQRCPLAPTWIPKPTPNLPRTRTLTRPQEPNPTPGPNPAAALPAVMECCSATKHRRSSALGPPPPLLFVAGARLLHP